MYINQFTGMQHIESDFTVAQKKPILRVDNRGFKEQWREDGQAGPRVIDALEAMAYGRNILVAECGERLDWAYKPFTSTTGRRKIRICQHCLREVIKQEKRKGCTKSKELVWNKKYWTSPKLRV